MAGRPKVFDTEAVINKAIEVFWTKGYEASSTEDLLMAMGIGKGSFYLAFEGGKRELFEKALEQFSKQSLQRFRNDLATSKDPIELLRDFFRSIAMHSEEIHQKGCFLGNSIAELSTIDKPLQQKPITLLKELEKVFEETIWEAQQSGNLQTKEEATKLAKYLINVWNGLNISRRMYSDPTILKSLIEMHLKVLV
ncbi:TetR/AcrR family transcriptional regulator [Xanthocytophaga agilis]|uniref:TetR/AcrR family transcriptional regulator n=1 Tax=Xanthocytophaga agilis TaxID=3048010 RepID=A0AAE3R3M1_9BACT|nr:TetR/AcrR family transcriptional regulator [Xanthocytophaga agilis]MDJ1503114.1 TetR/AcrR family transcriptional regulator [Xanthocytophaga agilis]